MAKSFLTGGKTPEEVKYGPPKSAFEETLDWMGLFGQVPMNLLQGRGEAAGRAALDIVGKPLDVLPGDYIPDFSTDEYRTSGSEILGMGIGTHPAARALGDIGVGIGMDPLTYVTAGASTAGKLKKAADVVGRARAAGAAGINFADEAANVLQKGLSKVGKQRLAAEPTWIDDLARQASAMDDPAEFLMRAVKDNPAFEQGGVKFLGKQIASQEALAGLIPGPVKQAAAKIGDKTAKVGSEFRSIFNWLNEPAKARHMRIQAAAEGANAAKVWMERSRKMLDDLSPEQRVAFGEAANNIQRSEDGFTRLLAQGEIPGQPFMDAGTRIARLTERMKAHPGLKSLGNDGIQKLADDWVSLTDDMYNTEVAKGALYSPRMWMRTAADGSPEMSYASDLARQYADQGGKVSRELNKLIGQIDNAEDALQTASLGKKADVLAQFQDEMTDLESAVVAWADDNADFQRWARSQGYELKDIPQGYAPKDYFPRQFTVEGAAAKGGPGSARPNFASGRTLTTTQDLLEFLNRPGVDLERDALVAIASRAEQSGKQIERAQYARKLLGDEGVTIAGGNTTKMVESIADNLRASDPDFAKIIDATINGKVPRGTLTTWLNSANRMFKPAAVYGVFMPRFAGIFRNRISAEWQKFSTGLSSAFTNPAKLADVGRDYVTAFGDAAVDAYGLKIPKSELGKAIGAWDDAVRAARTPDEAVAMLRQNHPMVAEAVQNGVLDTFVSGEELLKSLGEYQGGISKWIGKAANKTLGKSGAQKLFDYMDMPANAFQNSESYVRLATFMDLRRSGVTAERAADIVRETFLDYSVPTVGNRTARDIIPFFAFLSQSLPQQAKLLAKRPAVGVALNELYGDTSEEPLLPYIGEQASIPVGRDLEGNLKHLVGLGLPVETLQAIPNIGASPTQMGRDIERSIVGSMQPLLKTGYSMLSGRDPFFGTQYGSYDKTPEILQEMGIDERSELGRAYKVARGLGLAQVVATPVDQLSRIADDRYTPVERVMNLLTGTKIASNDAERARIMQLTDTLNRNPEAAQSVRYYAPKGADPELSDQINLLNKLIREKRKQAKIKKRKERQAFID